MASGAFQLIILPSQHPNEVTLPPLKTESYGQVAITLTFSKDGVKNEDVNISILHHMLIYVCVLVAMPTGMLLSWKHENQFHSPSIHNYKLH